MMRLMKNDLVTPVTPVGGGPVTHHHRCIPRGMCTVVSDNVTTEIDVIGGATVSI
jgi:hypothetical protein